MTKTIREVAPPVPEASKMDAQQPKLERKYSLDDHKDEVWDVSFSNDGKRLASCGADKTAIIYEVEGFFKVQHVLQGHSAGIGSLAWSPDDSKIVTCSQDNTARVWDTATGECLRTLQGFDDPVTGCSWLSFGERFITTSLSSHMGLCLWSLDGSLIYRFPLEDLAVCILGCVILPVTQELATFDNQKNVHVHNLQSQSLVHTSTSEVNVSSVCVSRLGKPFALLLKKDGLIEMIDVTTKTLDMVKVFKLKSCGNFVIKATFGGEDEEFVASGSEDGDIYLWETASGKLLSRLSAHPASCNSVTWNPKVHHMIASAGDDWTVKILIVNNRDNSVEDKEDESWEHVNPGQYETT